MLENKNNLHLEQLYEQTMDLNTGKRSLKKSTQLGKTYASINVAAAACLWRRCLPEA